MNHRTMQLAVAFVAVLAVGFGFAGPLAADPGRGSTILCYVWANEPTRTIGSAYTPSSAYSYNAVGRFQANTIVRSAVGVYTVTCKGVGGGPLFARQGEAEIEERSLTNEQVERAEESGGEASGTWSFGGHVQVSAYGSEDADTCKVSSWGTGGADFTASVRCYNHLGQLSDNRFDLLFVW
jgi:hypothetical protein